MTAKKLAKYPGWRHMTAAQRYNARMHRIFEEALRLKTETRFNESSRFDRREDRKVA